MTTITIPDRAARCGEGKYLTVLIHPDTPKKREGLWSDSTGEEFQYGTMHYEACSDSFVIQKFAEQGYSINIVIDTVPLS